MRKRAAFWTIYGVMLVGVTLAGLELVCSYIVPPWPAYVLRPTFVTQASFAQVNKATPETPTFVNSWGMRDLERSVVRPAGVGERVVFVGDSFLEGAFTRAALSTRVDNLLAGHGIEVINLGVSGTGPADYYTRIRDVALKLRPDVIFLFIFSGNDFGEPAFSEPWPPILPRTSWAVRALTAAPSRIPPDETVRLLEMAGRPDRVHAIATYMKGRYLRDVPLEAIEEVLRRNGESYFSVFTDRPIDRELIQGWMVELMVKWETGTWAVPRNSDDAASVADMAGVANTVRWLRATERLATDHGVKLVPVLVPTGIVDPAYAAFWKPWPRLASHGLMAAAQLEAFARSIGPHIDLRPVLQDTPGTYRKTDGHWTEAGHDIVAAHLARYLAGTAQVGRLAGQ